MCYEYVAGKQVEAIMAFSEMDVDPRMCSEKPKKSIRNVSQV
jgi:hypothetical protein